MKMMKMLVYVLLVAMVTLSLSDAVIHNYPHIIKSNAIARIKQYNALHTGRYRRQAHTMTQKEKSKFVDAHNHFRRLEGASDMELMTWDDTLESMAVRWVARCKFEHGHPKEEPKKDGWVGQNIHRESGRRINLTYAIQSFYNEKRYYFYDSNSCSDVCGHYTQVVWATSRTVACAPRRCDRYFLVVCNYHPGGNVEGQKPYKKGPACSQCASGAGWCRDKLCDRKCKGPGDGCTCAARCYNCAKLDLKTCRCSCAAGWHGIDCSVPCKDTHKYCHNGWYSHSCSTGYVQKGCPVMCKKCTPDPNAKPNQCPVVKGPGAYKYTPPASSMYVKTQHQQLMMMMMMLVMLINNMTIIDSAGIY